LKKPGKYNGYRSAAAQITFLLGAGSGAGGEMSNYLNDRGLPGFTE
jgi:hypothetical protein